MKKIILISGVAMLWPAGTMAQVCTTPPSCDTLGYKQTASECTGQQMLKCPFDNAKVFCGGVACDSSFKYTGCTTTVGAFTTCGTKCKYTSCYSGWTLSGGNCVANACSGYQSSAYLNCASYDTCKSGNSTEYKCYQCNNCWGKNDWGTCNVSYKSTIDTNATAFDSCVDGGVTKYFSTACKKGYYVCDGRCTNVSVCSGSGGDA